MNDSFALIAVANSFLRHDASQQAYPLVHLQIEDAFIEIHDGLRAFPQSSAKVSSIS